MKCDICKKNEATIHQTLIVNGHKEELHYCEECSQKGLVGINKAFSIEDFFGAFLGKEMKTLSPACKKCGMTIETFKKTGRLGCEECYEDLREYILPIIENVHGRSTHVGRIPSEDDFKAELIESAQPKQEDRLTALAKELNAAIDKEDYEQAAVIRDKIKELKGAK